MTKIFFVYCNAHWRFEAKNKRREKSIIQPAKAVSKKQSKLFSSELRQISTNFDNFWHKDGKEAKII